MKSERYRQQFDFLRENDMATQGDISAFQARTEDALANSGQAAHEPQCAEKETEKAGPLPGNPEQAAPGGKAVQGV